jgi:CRP-like cAMP-binding protein
VAHRNLTLVPKRNEVSQDSAPAFDILDFLNRFSPGKSRREYLTGEYVFSQGDTSNTVFYIQSGRVNLTLVSMSGKEAVIAHLPEGSFFGESALGGEPSRLCSASALQSAVIVRIEKTAMQGLLHSEQKFAHSFFEHLLARSIRMQADLVDHLFNSSEKRLARLLMMMANFGQKTQPIPVIEKISQETLADMIGTTRSRVSFFLNRFRSLGYIDYDCSGMRINSSLANIVLHD